MLSGGELAALTVVIDAMARLLPGVLGDERSSGEDSFAQGLLDWPHYTRPEVCEGGECRRCYCQGTTRASGAGACARRWSGHGGAGRI